MEHLRPTVNCHQASLPAQQCPRPARRALVPCRDGGTRFNRLFGPDSDKTELLNCPNETFAQGFVKFFYIGAIDKDLLEWHTVSFLHLADYYRIKELQTIAENSMILQLCKENVKEFLIAADMYQSARVKAASFDFLFKNRGTWTEEIEEWKPFISRELLCEIVIKLG